MGNQRLLEPERRKKAPVESLVKEGSDRAKEKPFAKNSKLAALFEKLAGTKKFGSHDSLQGKLTRAYERYPAIAESNLAKECRSTCGVTRLLSPALSAARLIAC
jgi:hypothetical protein